ncbi:DUF2490 domain-containing protein [Lewinella sp. JB7]|uniref:DUF2490 domain-containing protein n=1 Tax=Lewinella sp. JB7 TaxID=2962887 RepID=UPI0020CA0062|nr:DUF2490 domain-containing protein [Lewinella sp. JB7]MCP9235119.1 DUF2490 domain-containing protein [Lewinella sp. JB7]
MYKYLLIVFLYWAAPARAQLNLFTGASFERELNGDWAYEFEVEHRQVVGTGRENRALLLLAINRKLGDRMSLTPGIRVTPRYDPDVPTELRLFTDLNYDQPLGEGPFTLESRLRVQYERELAEGAAGHQAAVRPRLGLAYRVLKYTELVTEYEARYRFDRRNEFSRHRVTLGVSQRISTRVGAQAFVRLERDANVPAPNNEPTVGVYLTYLLPNARKHDIDYRRPFGRSLLW